MGYGDCIHAKEYTNRLFNRSIKEYQGMQILHFKLPCKCQIRGVQEETLHNFESCKVESQSVDILYPINIPLLSHFFNNSILNEVLTSTDFTNKTIIDLP